MKRIIASLILLASANLPAVQDVKDSNISVKDTSATISWSMPRAVVPRLFYGESIKECNRSIIGFQPTLKPEIVVDGLQPGTAYYYRAEFFSTNEVREFFQAGWFMTTGRRATRIERLDLIPSSSSVSIRVMTANPVEAIAVVSDRDGAKGTIPLVRKKDSSIKLEMNVPLNVRDYSADVAGLKPRTSYRLVLTMKDDTGKAIELSTNFTTSENNIALKKPVTGTFNSTFIADRVRLKGDVLSRVTDGSMDYLTGMAVSGDPEESDQWIVVDLGKEVELDMVIAYWRALAYPMVYEISVSRDGKEWSNTVTAKPANENQMVGNMPMKVDMTSLNGIRGRFVRLMVPQKTPCFKKYRSYRFVELMELKVYRKE